MYSPAAAMYAAAAAGYPGYIGYPVQYYPYYQAAVQPSIQPLRPTIMIPVSYLPPTSLTRSPHLTNYFTTPHYSNPYNEIIALKHAIIVLRVSRFQYYKINCDTFSTHLI